MSRKSLNGIDDSRAKAPKKESVPTIRIDFRKTAGAIKPLHGINNSPVAYGNPLPELTEAGIPYVRLHDAAGLFGGARFVDIPNVFPDFDADPDDPASYDFAFTDAYLKSLTSSGVKIFYRLGVTIENNWRVKAHHIHPPKDFGKWARICAGIVRHYNEGWAEGFHYGIEYWEIWNEPENPPMWTGTKEQYFELYRTTANYLKKKFPRIKVGGYASCGFYAVTREGMSDFYKSFVSYFEDFLEFVTDERTSAPLDFFSWHLYTSDPKEIGLHADYATKKLKEFGLAKTESVFNEWNCPDWRNPDCWDALKEMPGATFTAASFCVLQKSPVDKAMYYDALPERCYCGLYYFPSRKLTKTYYSFKAFNDLYKLGTAVDCDCEGCEEIYVCAAKGGGGKGAALIVNCSAQGKTLAFETAGTAKKASCLLLDSSHILTETGHSLSEGKLTLPPLSVILLRFG